MKFSFLKFYVMSPTEINLFGIVHVKLDFILLQKMYVIPSTYFVQCDLCNKHSINPEKLLKKLSQSHPNVVLMTSKTIYGRFHEIFRL